MSTAILQEALPFDFETDTQVYTEEARQDDVALCKRYFFGWADAFGSGKKITQSITVEEFHAAAKRLAR